MRPATPSARSRWRTKVVLPAPSGPCSSMKARGQRGLGGQRLRMGRTGGLVGPGRSGGFLEWVHAGRASLGAGSRSCSGCRGGRRAGILPDRHRRHRPDQRRSRACWPGWRPASTAHGLHGRAWPEARAAGRAGAGHGQRHHRAHGLPARATPAGLAARDGRACAAPRSAVVSLYARGATTTRCCASGCSSWPTGCQAEVGPLGPPRVHRLGPGAGGGTGRAQRLGWRGKHTLAADRDAGSMFFLGEIYVDLALPPEPAGERAIAASCSACIDVCPTQAIVAPYRLDARRCISYLTIEHDGPIPPSCAPPIGNRIYGCDDCQLACPWNKYAQRSPLPDFDAREGWARRHAAAACGAGARPSSCAAPKAVPIRRIGYMRWRRNLAVALGNAWREQRRCGAGPGAACSPRDGRRAGARTHRLGAGPRADHPGLKRASRQRTRAGPPCRSAWTRSPARPCSPVPAHAHGQHVALDAVGSAAKATITACWAGRQANQRTSSMAQAGSSRWRMASSAAARRGPSRSAPSCSPAPTAIKPSRQGRRADARQSGAGQIGQAQAQQVDRQARHGGDGSAGCAAVRADSPARRGGPAATPRPRCTAARTPP
jgi:epoxyqueuosine reductase